MTYIFKSRVREITATTGIGPIALGGAFSGFATFGSVLTTGQQVNYMIEDALNAVWESGSGTYTSATNSLSRDTVWESSNGGAPVNLLTGTKSVWIDFSATAVNSLSSMASSALQPSTLVSTLAATPARILAPVASLVGSGTGQSNGTLLSGQVNVITSAPAGTAFVIPVSAVGQTIEVRNKDTVNTASIFPFVGAKIDSGAVNALVQLPANSAVIFVVASTTQIWS